MSDIKILYVEDEPALATIVKDTLEGKGYQVQLVDDGNRVLDEFQSFQPHLCLLDVMLPNVDGFTLGKSINNSHPEIPIIYLTAKSQTNDVLEGFKSGGNDYLKKPFSLEELLVRIQNILHLKNNHSKMVQSDCISIGQYQYFPNKLILQINDTPKQLTHRESEIIQYFSENINGVIYKKDLLLKIWGDDSFYNARNLDVYINRMRDYFSEDSSISILTLRGVGYRFNIG